MKPVFETMPFRNYLNDDKMGGNFTWVLNQSYISPFGLNSHFGYSVGLNANLSVFGAYGYGIILYHYHYSNLKNILIHNLYFILII